MKKFVRWRSIGVDLMMKLGLVRSSMLLALALVVLAIVVQMAVTMVLHGRRKH